MVQSIMAGPSDTADALMPTAAASGALWQVEMLGGFRARRTAAASTVTDGDASPPPAVATIERFQTAKTALLFALLLQSGEALSRENLTLRLWPDAEAATGRDRLSQALSWLRRHLETQAGFATGAVFCADRARIGLTPGAITSDVARFDLLLAQAGRIDATDNVQRALCLEGAISLYAGPLLPGLCEEDDNLFHEAGRLALAYERVLGDAVRVCEILGRRAAAATYARRALAVSPSDPEVCLRLLRLLSRSGEPDEALRAFSAFRRRYREITGGAVPVAIEQFAETLRRQSESEASATVPERATDATRRRVSGLPPTLTRYFGRDEEIESLSASLARRENPLLTLVGSGGCGKTRLAIELARRFEGTPEPAPKGKPLQRAFFVPLETVLRARGIVPAIYLALGTGNSAREDGAPLRAAVATLLQEASSHPLLILDNAEHLAEDEEALHTLTDLLTRVPSLTLLVTSRRPLGHVGEQIFFLLPLQTPPAKASDTPQSDQNGQGDLTAYPSVRLFVDRARAVRRDFAIGEANRDTVAALCARLEGLPLAIELCAAWSATLTPEELLAKLENRFSLLTTRRPDVPPRHRGMYAAIDTSFVLLAPNLQSFFAALSVFRGGWFAEAAQAIVRGQDFDAQLARLQEQSLVVAERVRDPQSGIGEARTRFRLLDTIREFAEGKFLPEERARGAERHAAYYLALAERAEPHLNGSGQRAWMDLLEAEHDNLRAAFAHFDAKGDTEGDAAGGLRLAVALRYFWNRRGYQNEACEYLTHFLERHRDGTETAATPERIAREATAHNALGRALQSRGETGAGWEQQEAALRLWKSIGNAVGVARTFWEMGANARRRGEFARAADLFEDSLNLADAEGEDRIAAAVLLDLGSIALNEQDLPRAQRLTQESLERAQRADAIYLSTSALNNLGEVARVANDFVTAAAYYEEALRATRPLGDQLSGILPRLNLAEIARLTGDLPRAATLMHESLTVVRHLGEAFLAAQCLFATATLAATREEWERAALLAGAVDRLRQTMATRMAIADPDDESQLAQTLENVLGAVRYRIAMVRGGSAPLDAIFSFALSDRLSFEETV